MSEAGTNFWRIRVGHFKDCNIFVHFTTCLFLVWLVVDGGTDLGISFLPLGAFACALLIREVFRYFLSWHFRFKAKEKIVYPLSIYYNFISADFIPKRIIFHLAGIFLNIVVGVGIYFQNGGFNWLSQEREVSFFELFAIWNIYLAIINFIPIYPTDGYSLFRLLLQADKSENNLRRLQRFEFWLTLIVAAAVFSIADLSVCCAAVLLILPSFPLRAREKITIAADRYTCKEAMTALDNLVKFQRQITVSKAIEIVLHSAQMFYPVMNGDVVVGVVTREDVLSNIFSASDKYIASIAEDDLRVVPADVKLNKALEMMRERYQAIIVEENGVHIGLLTPLAVKQFIHIREAQRAIKESEDFIDEEI